MELPPRTRRIQLLHLYVYQLIGTTSAHAENTEYPSQKPQTGRNYLRARGEYWNNFIKPAWDAELPPRTRRIQKGNLKIMGIKGTTSAHAENTEHAFVSAYATGNYLRARGEYS